MKTILRLSGLIIFCFYFGINLYSQQEIISVDQNKTINNELVSPVRQFTDMGINGVEVQYTFTNSSVSRISIEQGDFQFIRIKDLNMMDQVGKPALPCRNDFIAVPRGANAKIIIAESEYVEYSGYMIHPVLEPAMDFEGAPEPEFVIDQKTYQSNSFYPKNIVEVVAAQKWRGIPLNLIQIRPVQFNPVTGIIRLYSKIKYRVEFSGSNKTFDYIASENSLHFTNLFKRAVLNYKSIPDGADLNSMENQHRTTGIRKDYILLAPSIYWMAADSLANWKRQLGYSVDVVLKNVWTSSQVEDSIAVRYNAWYPRPDFFVLIGDIDRMPTQLVGPSLNIHSDLYYACMDGVGDYVPDMARGRISVSSQTEALSVVMKIINYEKYPPVNYSFYNSGLNCAEFQDDEPDTYANRRFTHTSEEVRDYLINEGYTINRVYYSNPANNPLYFNNGYYSNGQSISSDLLIANGFQWDGDASDIIDGINSGKFYVLHRDHGYSYGWGSPGFSNSDINSLSNGNMTPVVFSINCSTGSFQVSECFAEKFLRMENSGAVGVIAASSTSSSGYNDGLAVGFFDAIWSSPGLTPAFGSGGNSNPSPTPHSDIFTMGDVLNHSLIRMSETWNTSERQHQLFHYFGDPAMKIWTAFPSTISVSHADSLQCGDTTLSLYSSSCPDAMATLCMNGEIIGMVQLSAGAGTISFPAIANVNPFVTLTLSKHNYRPYLAEIPIVNCTFSPQAIFSA
ncbi:MAG: C25 family cysteine peptidase [Bacteroidota bacterium]|nr:C25 family cysteine peptidase [Bacteroidota bacterium]